MSAAKNSVHPLVRRVRALQGAMAEWRYNCDPKDLRAAMWLEADIEQLSIRIEAITYTPNAGGEGRELCERTSPPPCSASPVAQPPRDVSELYHELLYAVARKFPGESRHETALRYIRDTEERAGQSGSCKQNAELSGEL